VGLNIESTKQDDLCVVVLAGEVDIYSVPELRSRFESFAEAGCRRIVLDLTDVDFVDSSVLGVLIHRSRLVAEAGGWMRIVCPRGQVLRVLQITGLDKQLEVFDDVEAARTA
jgi:anti-sigma B factor antagonist